MLEIFLKTLPFFAIIALGYGAAARRFFPPEATAYLTKFVFYFALSAMLFRFSVNLDIRELLNGQFIAAYISAGIVIYLLAFGVAWSRKTSFEETVFEAQCAISGNTGFLGIPMLALLLSERAVPSVMIVLVIDMMVFGSLIVILMTLSREGRLRFSVLGTVALGLAKNPMITAMFLGLAVSASGAVLPGPVDEFFKLLGAAATPGALFAIGASLANKSAERPSIAIWITFCKLALHPAAVAVFALFVFDVEPFAAAVMIAAASLPVAGNVFILAQHYDVAPQRVSTSILISTAISVLTVSAVIAWVTAGMNL